MGAAMAALAVAFAIAHPRLIAADPAPSSTPFSAAQMVQAARNGRAEWQDFPGFRADVVVSDGGRMARGKIVVSASGDVESNLSEAKDFDWVRKRIRSLVSHRLPNVERESDVAFADGEFDHPLGRRINFKNDDQDTVYRVQGDVLTEVQRTMGKTRFVLSVIEVSRNTEGKHLPRSYTVGYWDKELNKLAHSDTFYYEWIRVGKFDLPRRQLVIAVADGQHTVQEIEFFNVELLDSVAAR